MDHIIDYLKFRCDIFSPDGKYITRARINDAHLFYCPLMVVGQDYYIVFSYDDILLQVFLFNGNQAGKVMYISPANIIFSHTPIDLPYKLMQAIKPLQQKCNDYQIPQMPWANKALDLCVQAARGSSSKFVCRHKPTPFRPGNALSGQVK